MGDAIHKISKDILTRCDETKKTRDPAGNVTGLLYPPADWLIKPTWVPDRDTLVGTVRRYRKISGTNVSVMDATEQAAVDNSATVIADEKKKLHKEIDAKTEVLRSAGFEFPAASGNMLSMSDRAQTKINGIFDMDASDFPHPVSKVDETKLVLATQGEAVQLRMAMVLRLNVGILREGTNLKDQVVGATTSGDLATIRTNNNARV